VSLGVLGGTFDPIHVAHLRLAEELRESLSLERVLFVPAARPPLKSGALAAFADRVEMARLATASNPGFDVSDLESEREGPSYTVDTLREIARRHPGERLWFLLGSDTVRDLDQWHEPRALFELASLAIVSRPGSGAASVGELIPASLAGELRDGPEGLLHPSGNELRLLPFAPLSVSASEIRRRIALGASVRYLVPDAVLDYVRKHRLYETNEESA
jgi:nicotinate-nucleotide adenylyltransferase